MSAAGPLASGVGSFPGEHQRDLDEAVRVVLGELGESGEPGQPAADAAPGAGSDGARTSGGGLPFVPEVPGRGAPAGMVGRTLGLLAAVDALDADLQPEGWRLTGTAGAPPIDQRRARSLLAQDLDTWEERAAGYTGPVKTQVAGPWTLAATVERPRGDKVLADHGARRELAQALAMAVAEHVGDLRRRTAGADRVVVQVDEPALPAVLAGRIPTASGFGKHRVVHPPEADEALRTVLDAVRDAGAEPWVHCCAPQPPVGLLRGAGAHGIAVDLGLLTPDAHDALAQTLEDGGVVVLGLLPTATPAAAAGADAWTDTAVVERVQRWFDLTGLDPAEHVDRVVLTPACGLAGADAAWARHAVRLAARSARALADASYS